MHIERLNCTEMRIGIQYYYEGLNVGSFISVFYDFPRHLFLFVILHVPLFSLFIIKRLTFLYSLQLNASLSSMLYCKAPGFSLFFSVKRLTIIYFYILHFPLFSFPHSKAPHFFLVLQLSLIFLSPRFSLNPLCSWLVVVYINKMCRLLFLIM